ncbi:MAG: glycosyltransferase family 39 protein [Spirochaetes bacterium]|nr:glycosyltransferase family 39 protein [Spirochaetota bacterium]
MKKKKKYFDQPVREKTDVKKFFKTNEPLLLSLFLTAAAILYFSHLNDFFSLDGDNVVYSLLAKALLKGKGFVDIRTPFTPAFASYWPGFPFLLIPSTLLLPDNIIALKIVPVLFTLLSLFYLYQYFKMKFDILWAFLALFFIMINPVIFHFAHTVLSQAPFLASVIMAAYYLEKYIRENKSTFGKEFIIFTIATVAAKYIREEGTFLFLIMLFYILIHKKFKAAGVFAGFFIITNVAWMLYMKKAMAATAPHIKKYFFGMRSSRYINLLAADQFDPDKGFVTLPVLFNRIYQNFLLYFNIIIPRITLGFNVGNSLLVALITAFFVFYGFFISLPVKKIKPFITFVKENATPAVLYFFFGLGLVHLSISRSEKYLYPIIPFMLFFIIYGLYQLVRRMTKNYTRIVFGILVFILVYFSFSRTSELMSIERNFQYDPVFTHYLELAKWFRVNTPEDTKVLSRKGEYFYWYSQRQSATHQVTTNTFAILEFIKDMDFDYVLLTQTGFDYVSRPSLDRVIQSYPRFFINPKGGYVPNTGNQRQFFILQVNKPLLRQFIKERRKSD